MRGRSCVVVRGRARWCVVVRGRACVVGHAWSCAVVRAWSVIRGRAWSCAVGRAWSCVVLRSCRAASFAASTAVTRTNEGTNERTTSNNPLNPPGVGWVNFCYPIKVRVSMGTCAKFGSDPTAGSKILSFKFISRCETTAVAEWLRAWDTLTMFEATVCGRS